MKTDDLVEALSARIDPVDFRAVGRRIALAVVAGSVLAVAAILIGFGPRAGLSTVGAWTFLFLKIAFAAAIAGTAATYLTRLSRPGGALKHGTLLVILPFVVIVALALVSLGSAPVSHWDRMVAGSLHRRFATFCGGLVRWNDRGVHPGGGRARAAATAVVRRCSNGRTRNRDKCGRCSPERRANSENL